MPVMKRLRIGSVDYDTVGSASVTQTLTSGTEIATVTIDGTATKLYAPSGGGGGSTVTVTPILTSGTQTATISVDGTDTTLYAPTELPNVTSSDNGKVLQVVDGAWAAASIPSASGVSF